MIWNFIVPPIVGAAIGYVTNDIAIKMLFHPRKAYYIGKWRIPFTPGLIPKRKSEIARSLGNVVGQQLLNEDVVKATLLSEKITGKLRSKMEEFIEKNAKNEQSLDEFIERFSPKAVTDKFVDEVKGDVSSLIYRKIVQFECGAKISELAVAKVLDRMNGGMFAMFTAFIDDSVIESIRNSLAEYIDNLIEENAEDMIEELIDKETDKLRGMQVCDIIEKYSEKIPKLIDFVMDMYTKFINNNLSSALRGIDIAGIVKNRIDAFDVMELEKMIFGIMKRELNAIVYLGALLGFLMGCINIFI